MRRLFETVLALVFAVVFTHSACAGSAVVTPNWTGFYIGANAGYGWGDPDSFLRWQRASDDRFSAPLTPGHYVTKPSGGIVGIQGGYNHQINAFVLGIEADFQIADISGSTRTPSTFLPIANDFAHFSESQRLKTFGTVRGRAGFLVTPDLLLFATGGLAYGRVQTGGDWQYETPPLFHYLGFNTATKTGWTVGGGAEWAIDRAWSLKVEYLYYDLDSIRINAHQEGDPASFFFLTLDQKITGNIVRGGLNFRF